MELRDFVLGAANGMRIVSSGDLTAHQISEARSSNRFWVDEETGLGFALLPWEQTTDEDREREADYFNRNNMMVKSKMCLNSERLVGPGVNGVSRLPVAEKELWRTVIRRLCEGVNGTWVVVPLWCSRVAVQVEDLGWVKWDVDMAKVACNQKCLSADDLVFGPLDCVGAKL